MTAYTTPGGKEIQLVNVGNLIKVQFTTGGELPEELSGLFTSVWFADIAITKYLEKANAKNRQRKAD